MPYHALDPGAYVVVVGNMNADICAKSSAPLELHDSNPGTVRISPGGVGRNIAHNLCLLGANVHMLSAVGADTFANYLEETCIECGMDVSHVLHVKHGVTPTYAFIADPDGEMAVAVCDAELSEQISPEYLADHAQLLRQAAAVVVETNLSENALRYLAETCQGPLFADTVSVAKCSRLLPIMGRIHTLKPNLLEAEKLSGISIRDQGSLEAAAAAILKKGVKRVFISLGADGVFYADHAQCRREPCFQTHLVNATGGGDAMMAAITFAFLCGMSAEETVRFALAASAICVESEATISGNMKFDRVIQRMRTT